MLKYDFDTEYNRKGTGCFKTDGLKMIFGKDDLLPLWVADMDFAIAPEILRALQNRLNHPIFGYNLRLSAYYDSIINWLQKRYNWQIKQDWIVSTPGVVTAINAAVITLTSPGDGILIQTPVYDPFFHAITSHGRKLLTNSLKLVDNDYVIDFFDFERKISQCRMFILCNPHNPIGRVWNDAELRQMGEICKKYKVLVVSDEIHADIVFSGYRFTAFGKIDDFEDFTIACYSPSKSFNLAGLCTSAIVIKNDVIRSKFNHYIESMHLFLGNSFGITGLQAAYSLGENWLEALIVYLESNLKYISRFLADNLTTMHLIYPQGSYLAWIDCRKLGLSDDQLSKTLIEKCGLALSMGRTYGEDGTGFIRLNFGTPVSNVKLACEKLYNTFK